MTQPEKVTAPTPGAVVAVAVGVGDHVSAGQTLCVIESMKLEHPVPSPVAGTVESVPVAVGDLVVVGDTVATVTPGSIASGTGTGSPAEHDGSLLDEVETRRIVTTDAARPGAVERIHGRDHLTAREKVSLLLNGGPLHEYGTFVIAAQRARRPLEDLIERTPADGLVAGIGTVNETDIAVLAYDYTVLAGTQGVQNHRKTDRLLDIAARKGLPVVLFADGGGGRPGDTEMAGRSGLDVPTFASLARMSGTVPLIAVVSGYCFAGNAILAGMCDVIIATADAHIGAGGPAMIEGGGLGSVAPDEIGPATVHARTGVVHVVVDTDEDAVATARQYLGYFQGRSDTWEAPDQATLRTAIPSNRRTAYDIHTIVSTVADQGSVLELREAYAPALVTALARIEGTAVGIIANDPRHGGGAIDAGAASKAGDFFNLCAAFSIPVVSLIDTPGIMVGPEAEHDGTLGHASAMFIAGAAMPTPVMAVVTRRGYGLGAMAMAAGGFKETAFTVAWPSATIGPMGLEGAVTLGYRKELETIEGDEERTARYEELVADAYDDGKALNAATWFDIDEVIDPADTRSWIVRFLRP